MQPVWISYLSTDQQSSDSSTEIFITVSISHALIALYLSDGETKRGMQTTAERGRDMEGKEEVDKIVHVIHCKTPKSTLSKSASQIHIYISQLSLVLNIEL